jgi:hypothetical protein
MGWTASCSTGTILLYTGGLIHRIENLNGCEFDDDVAGLLVGSGH